MAKKKSQIVKKTKAGSSNVSELLNYVFLVFDLGTISYFISTRVKSTVSDTATELSLAATIMFMLIIAIIIIERTTGKITTKIMTTRAITTFVSIVLFVLSAAIAKVVIDAFGLK
jgi:hypothetical protein